MPNRFTIRFYSVEKFRPNDFSFQQALEHAYGIECAERHRQLAPGLTARLERYDNDSGELAGEFTRVRTTNYPYEVLDDGAGRLPTDRPIGEGIAFRFRPGDHTLAIQYDTKILSPGRAMDYLLQCDGRAGFKITPKIDPENWRKFREHPVRKLRVGIASPDHLGQIEDDGASVARAFEQLGDAYGAPVITLEMSMGHRRGELAAAAKGMARAISNLARGGGADLRSLTAKVKANDDTPAEDINLIDEIISEKNEIDLPQNDPEHSYTMRNNFLRERLAQHGDRR